MRKLLWVTLCLSALSAMVMLTCDQVYDNPVSDKYLGDYKCHMFWEQLDTSSLEVFKKYTFTVTDTGKDKYYTFKISNESVVVLDQEKTENSTRFTVLFKQPFTGDLNFVAVRPNLKEDNYSKSVNVINPYKIYGDTLVGRNVPAKLFVNRTDEAPLDSNKFEVIWIRDSLFTDTTDIHDQFEIGYKNQGYATVTAIIKDEAGNGLALSPCTVEFKGFAPEIESVELLDVLRLGYRPKIQLNYSNDDTGKVTFTVYATEHKKTMAVASYRSSSNAKILIECDSIISDTVMTSLLIQAQDSEGLISVPKAIKDLEVTYSIPEVQMMGENDTFLFRFESKPEFVAIGDADSFLWILDDDVKKIYTDKSFLQLDTLKDSLPHTLTLKGFNTYGNFRLYSNQVTVAYKSKMTRIQIEEVAFPTVIKIKSIYTWEVKAVDKLGIALDKDSVQYIWSFSDSSNLKYNEDSSKISMMFADSVKSFKLQVVAFSGSDTSLPFTKMITTRVYKPFCKIIPPKSDTVKLMDSLTFKANTADSDPDGRVDSVYFKMKFPGGESGWKPLKPNGAYVYRFLHKGKHALIAQAVDDMGNRSNFDTLILYSITEKPSFKNSRIDTVLYVDDSLKIEALTENSLDSISIFIWDLNGDNIYDTTTLSNEMSRHFPDTGEFKLMAGCVSILKDTVVEPLVINVKVLPGIPVIDSVTKTGAGFVNDTYTFDIFARDFGRTGKIEKYQVSFDNKKFTTLDGSSFDTTFTSYGSKTVYFKVIDNAGNHYVYRDSLFVRQGIPVVNSVKVDFTESKLYVKDDFTLNFTVSDTNGTIKNVQVSWDGDTIPEEIFIPDELDREVEGSFIHQFDTSTYGQISIKIWAVDDDGIRSKITTHKVNVNKGIPVIADIVPSQVWVNDYNSIKIVTSDNGPTIKTWIDWDKDGIWDDSSRAQNPGFPGQWDTTFGGKYITFNAKVMDEDSFTVTKKCSVLVRMGRPMLSGGATYGYPILWKADTMFYIWKEGQPTTAVVDTADTNGKCVRFYWDWLDRGLKDTITTVPLLSLHGLRIHEANRVTVICKDDDSLISNPFTFFVFPDEPPSAIRFPHRNDTSRGIVTIKWRGGEDLRDGDNLLIKIVVKKKMGAELDSITIEDESNPAYIVSFKPRKEYEYVPIKDGKEMIFTYKPDQGSGIYYYRVIAIDACNSVSRSFEDGFLFEN